MVSQSILNQKSDEINQRLRELGFSDIKKLRKKHENQVFIDAFTDLDFELDQRSKSNNEPLKNVGAWLRGRLPEQGQPYQYSSTYEKRLVVEKAKAELLKKEQERLKKESEEEAERQRQIKEVSAKVDAKIVEIKGSDEWQEIQEQARIQAEKIISKPQNNPKELTEFAERKLETLPKDEQKSIKKEAVEFVKEHLKALEMDFNSPAVQNAVRNHQIKLVKERYQAEFPESPAMKQYQERLTKHMEMETRHIIKKRYQL